MRITPAASSKRSAIRSTWSMGAAAASPPLTAGFAMKLAPSAANSSARSGTSMLWSPPSLFEGPKAEGAAQIGARFHEFVAYVASHPNLERAGFRLQGTVAYHDSCHYRRELGLSALALGVLAQVEGLEVRRLQYEEECCGFGGSFSVKLPEVSAGIMRAKLEDVAGSGAHVLVSADFSCLAHLDAGARGLGQRLETWTIAELLARALE
jgi:L-lactate dehydrogenase complex protein LldE